MIGFFPLHKSLPKVYFYLFLASCSRLRCDTTVSRWFCASRSDKPPIGLDEFFSSVEIHGLALAPDGSMAVIGTERADWKRNRFRDDLWIWRANDNSLAPLTTTGHDSDPHFSRTGTISRFSLIVP